MEFTTKEIILAVLGSGGFIGGFIAIFVFITARLDKKRERDKALLESEITKTSDMKRFELDSSNSVHSQLWEIINEHKAENKLLSEQVEELERIAVLQWPTRLKIHANLRQMRKEIESLNLMILSEDETNVFMRRFQTVKVLLDETEGMLSAASDPPVDKKTEEKV